MNTVSQSLDFQRGKSSEESLDIGLYSTSQLIDEEHEFLKETIKRYTIDSDYKESLLSNESINRRVSRIFDNKLTKKEVLKYWVEYKDNRKDKTADLMGGIYSKIIPSGGNYSTKYIEISGITKFRDYMLYKMKPFASENLEWIKWLKDHINGIE